MKVVLDTGALIASFAKSSPFRPIYAALLAGKYILVVSTHTLLEYVEKVEEKTTPEIAQNVSDLLMALPNIERKNIHFTWNLIENDPDDNKFADCYIAAGADYLVSNDRHFNVLKSDGFPPVRVVSVEEFLAIVATL